MLTNTFHSSTGRHSIKNAASLAKVQNHNSRGNFSIEFDPTKIVDLIGSAANIRSDVENAINSIFDPVFAQYNTSRISMGRSLVTETPFEYFSGNKTLDVACEAILQLGHNQFWSRFRHDTCFLIIDRMHVIKEYPDFVKSAMNSLFKKQAFAYEHIYETHGQEILQRINDAYNEATEIVETYNQLRPEFQEYSKMLRLDLARILYASDDETREAYAKYAQASRTIKEIESKRLRERIEAGEMHIRVICLTAHYDEFSPHGHMVSLCFSDGHKQGPASKVSKSIVLNRWALEVIQERLHEIAEEEMLACPEIFKGEKLLPKEKGRNFNYTTEQITRRNILKLLEQLHDLETSVSEKQKLAFTIQESIDLSKKEARETRQEYEDILVLLHNTYEHLCTLSGNVALIEAYSDYDYQENELEKSMNSILRLLNNLGTAAKLFKDKAASRYIKDTKEDLFSIYGALTYWYNHIKKYEEKAVLPPAQRKSLSLDEKILEASRHFQKEKTPTPHNRSEHSK